MEALQTRLGSKTGTMPGREAQNLEGKIASRGVEMKPPASLTSLREIP